VTLTRATAQTTPRGCPDGGNRSTSRRRRKGVRPVERVEDTAVDGVFSTDEELEEFIAYTYANRRERHP